VTHPVDGFPGRLARARADRGLTLRQVAEGAGVTRGAVSHYEQGRCAPSARTLVDLAATLGVTLDWLLAGVAVPQGRPTCPPAPRPR